MTRRDLLRKILDDSKINEVFPELRGVNTYEDLTQVFNMYPIEKGVVSYFMKTFAKPSVNTSTVLNATKSFIKNIPDLSPSEDWESRLAICRECPILESGICSSAKGGCGCPVHKKTKRKKDTCPKGKW